MPPKPFNPPRPSSTSSSSKVTKSKAKPKATKPTFTAPSASSKVTKSKPKEKNGKVDKGKGKERSGGGFAAASTIANTPNGGRFHLPSLSPDSDVPMPDEGEVEEDEDVEQDEESGQELSELSDLYEVEIVSKSKTKSKRSNGRRESEHELQSEDEDEEEAEAKESIPLPLLQVLLQTHFSSINQNKSGNGGRKTRIAPEAIEAVGKYIDTFVREAIARAAYDSEGGDQGSGEQGGNGVLEVESLERICPQLLLDF